MWLWLDRVNDVWKLDSVLYEENRYVVADEVPVSFISIEFHGEAPNIANSVLKT